MSMHVNCQEPTQWKVEPSSMVFLIMFSYHCPADLPSRQTCILNGKISKIKIQVIKVENIWMTQEYTNKNISINIQKSSNMQETGHLIQK